MPVIGIEQSGAVAPRPSPDAAPQRHPLPQGERGISAPPPLKGRIWHEWLGSCGTLVAGGCSAQTKDDRRIARCPGRVAPHHAFEQRRVQMARQPWREMR